MSVKSEVCESASEKIRSKSLEYNRQLAERARKQGHRYFDINNHLIDYRCEAGGAATWGGVSQSELCYARHTSGDLYHAKNETTWKLWIELCWCDSSGGNRAAAGRNDGNNQEGTEDIYSGTSSCCGNGLVLPTICPICYWNPTWLSCTYAFTNAGAGTVWQNAHIKRNELCRTAFGVVALPYLHWPACRFLL